MGPPHDPLDSPAASNSPAFMSEWAVRPALVSSWGVVLRRFGVTLLLRAVGRLLRSSKFLALLFFVISSLATMGIGYSLTQHTVTIEINGRPIRVRTHQVTARAILREVGISIAPEDIVHTDLDARLAPGQSIVMTLARPARGRSSLARRCAGSSLRSSRAT